MLSVRAKYALRAMIHLAAVKDGEPVSVSDIAESAHVPRAFLEQILAQLRKSGLLVGIRGKQGGFRLARSARYISFADVIRPIDGPLAPAPCASRTAFQPCPECVDIKSCQIRPTLLRVRNASAGIFEKTTLESAIRPRKR